jgi:hypothetical protein
MFVGTGSSLPQRIAPERGFTQVNCKHKTRLKRLAGPNTNLLRKFVNYCRKKVYNIGSIGDNEKNIYNFDTRTTTQITIRLKLLLL